MRTDGARMNSQNAVAVVGISRRYSSDLVIHWNARSLSANGLEHTKGRDITTVEGGEIPADLEAAWRNQNDYWEMCPRLGEV